MTNDEYTWTDNPTVSGVSVCNTDILNECLMHLKYDHKGNGAGLNLFDVIEKDHILSTEESKGFAPLGTYVYKEPASSNRYGYPDFYAKCMEEKADGLEVEIQLEENTITVYKNMNGHIFYNIADKDVVDLYYIHTGACWMYGIDEENERIFLPRNDWFTMSGKSDEVGEFVEAGLPNITGAFDRPNRNGAGAATGAFSNGASVGGYARDGAVDSSLVNFDASNSNSIYGKSDTVQPPAVKKILYMVVGNTEVTSSITNVTEITTSENDTIPLFTAQYFDFTPNNPSWLKAGTQQNSGGIYTTAYNTLVNCLTDNIYNIKVVDTANMTLGVDYSEFWKVDQLNMTFTAPTSVSNKALTGAVVGNGSSIGFISPNYFIDTTGLCLASSGAGSEFSNYRFLTRGEDVGVSTDPTKSGIIAEESTTAQLYFKVANAVQNLELLDVGEVLEALTLKTDMLQASGAGMPSNKIVQLTTGASNTSYTAPANGYFRFSSLASSSGQGWAYMSSSSGLTVQPSNSPYNGVNGFIPVKKGDVVTIEYINMANTPYIAFIYAQGSEGEV